MPTSYNLLEVILNYITQFTLVYIKTTYYHHTTLQQSLSQTIPSYLLIYTQTSL